MMNPLNGLIKTIEGIHHFSVANLIKHQHTSY